MTQSRVSRDGNVYSIHASRINVENLTPNQIVLRSFSQIFRELSKIESNIDELDLGIEGKLSTLNSITKCTNVLAENLFSHIQPAIVRNSMK